MSDNTSLVRCIVGPVGSGKSFGCIMEILRRATMQAPDASGTRLTRWALIRNTLQQLRATVLADVQNYLGPVTNFRVTDQTVQIRADLPDGTRLHADLMLIPLDTKEDQQRLLSLQLTGAWINEAREVPIDVVSALIGRLGRFPSKVQGGPTWFGLLMDTNPWDTESPYHDRFVLNPQRGWSLYHQPSGIGPEAENVQNLPPGYYENLAGDQNADWVSVHVESNWGASNAGQAVFRKSFHAPTHVREMQVVVNPHRPVLVGLDFGRTPCAVIGQVDTFGRAIIMKEVITENMGLEMMLREHLKPILLGDPFAGKRIIVVGDPAGTQKSQVNEECPFDVLKQNGFTAVPAPTNNVDTRLRAVEKLMSQQLMGEPAFQISRAGCPTLVKALGSSYRFRKKRDGQLEDMPEKSHPWSDIADACQYFCLGTNANLVGKVLQRDARTHRARAPGMPVAAWT